MPRREVFTETWHTSSGGENAGSDVSEGKQLVESLLRLMSQHGYPERDGFAVHLALEEALANAVRHGNQRDPTKRVRIDYELNGQRLLVRVTDQGAGFAPSRVPDPTLPENLETASGRGLLLMRQFMTWIRFNRRGNQVTMCLHRSNGRPEGEKEASSNDGIP